MVARKDTRTDTYIAASEIDAVNKRVALTASGVAIAGATDHSIGTALNMAATGEEVTVLLHAKEGTAVFIASGAGAIGNYAIGAADGKVSLSGTKPSTTNALLGIAASAALGNDSPVEIVPCIVGL